MAPGISPQFVANPILGFSKMTGGPLAKFGSARHFPDRKASDSKLLGAKLLESISEEDLECAAGRNGGSFISLSEVVFDQRLLF